MGPHAQLSQIVRSSGWGLGLGHPPCRFSYTRVHRTEDRASVEHVRERGVRTCTTRAAAHLLLDSLAAQRSVAAAPATTPVSTAAPASASAPAPAVAAILCKRRGTDQQAGHVRWDKVRACGPRCQGCSVAKALTLLALADGDATAVKIGAIELLHGLRARDGRLHVDEAEPLGATILVRHDNDRGDRSIALEHLAQLVLGRRVRHVAHEAAVAPDGLGRLPRLQRPPASRAAGWLEAKEENRGAWSWHAHERGGWDRGACMLTATRAFISSGYSTRSMSVGLSCRRDPVWNHSWLQMEQRTCLPLVKSLGSTSYVALHRLHVSTFSAAAMLRNAGGCRMRKCVEEAACRKRLGAATPLERPPT